MHRDVVTHALSAPRRGFLVSASADGQVKFWARAGYGGGGARGGGLRGAGVQQGGVQKGGARGMEMEDRPLEFVKQFRAHSGRVDCMALSPDGGLLVTVSAADRTAKVFSVDTFDMLGFVRLEFVPGESVVWVEEKKSAVLRFAVAFKDEPKVALFAADALGRKPRVLRLPHVAPVILMELNEKFEAVVSIDEKGFVEYWMPERLGSDSVVADGREYDGDGDTNSGEVGSSDGDGEGDLRTDIPGVVFEFKGDTNLFDFAKAKTRPTSLHISADGTQFLCTALDRVIRVFYFRTGKLRRSYNESLDAVNTEFRSWVNRRSAAGESGPGAAEGDGDDGGKHLGAQGIVAAEADFTRRMERERDLAADVNCSLRRSNAIFDVSGNFVLYATVLGIKVVNLVTNTVSRTLGRWEGAERFLSLALFQEIAGASGSATGRSSARNKVESLEPLLVATSFDSQRVFLFTRTEPPEGEERDIYNEKVLTRRGSHAIKSGTVAKAVQPGPKLAKRVTLHTTAGDITFVTLGHAPRAVENFTVHAGNGYFNNVLYVIVPPSFKSDN